MDRAKRLVRFKQSLDKAMSEVASCSEKNRKKQAEQQERQRTEALHLIGAGQNPAQVYKIREVESRVERKTQTLAQEQQRRKAILIERLADEDRWQETIEAHERQQRNSERRFEEEIGILRQREISNYLHKMTGVEDPSAVASTAAEGGNMIFASSLIRKTTGTTRASTRFPCSDGTGTDTLANDTRCSRFTFSDNDDKDLGNCASFARREKFQWKPKLSKFERQSLRRSLNAQKQNMLRGEVQKAAGKVHTGPSFRAKPEIIHFENFEPGQVYKKTIEVTNISMTFNTFRIVPVPEDLRDIIEVDFTPPGRMSAGTTTSFTVTFCPKKNADVISKISILAPTGPEEFPLRCSTKKTVLTFSPPLVDVQDFIANAREDSSSTEADAPNEATHTDATPLASELRPQGLERHGSSATSFSRPADGEAEGLERMLALDMGELQLGAVGTCSLRIRNEGALASEYLLLPLVCNVSSLSFPLSRPSEDSPVLPGTDDALPSTLLPGEAESAAEPPLSASGPALASQTGGKTGSDATQRKGDEGERSRDTTGYAASPAAFSEPFQDTLEAVEMVSADKLVTGASFNEGQRLADIPGLLNLLNQWTYEPMNLQHLVLENAISSFAPRKMTAIRFSYAPFEPGDFYALFLLKTRNPLVRDRLVAVQCRCLPPPISVESAQYDFGVCIVGNTYSQQLSFHNSQNSTMKVWVTSPSLGSEGELCLEPRSSFIQAHQRLTVTATFRPKEEFFDRFPQYVQELDADVRRKHPGSLAFAILVRVEGADQVLPVETRLTGMVTRKEIVVSPPTLDFGPCCEGSAVSTPLVLFNPSLLIMEYAFCRLHQDIAIYNSCDADNLCPDSSVASLSSSSSSSSSAFPAFPAFPAAVSPSSKHALRWVDAFDSKATGTRALSSSVCTPGPRSPFAGPPSFSPAFLSELEEQHILPQNRLTHMQRGEYGYLLPGEIRKVLAVYSPNKHSPESSNFGGLRTDPSDSGVRTDAFVLRTLVGSQAALETRISWKAAPSLAKVSFTPAATLRLPAVPIEESVCGTLYMRLLPSRFPKGFQATKKLAFLAPTSSSGPSSVSSPPLSSPSLKVTSEQAGAERREEAASSDATLGPYASPAVRPCGRGRLRTETENSRKKPCSPPSLSHDAQEENACCGVLWVEVLAPPFALAALQFNPACFALSAREPSQKIAVSFSPDGAYLRRTAKKPSISPQVPARSEADTLARSPVLGGTQMGRDQTREEVGISPAAAGLGQAAAGEKPREHPNEKAPKTLTFAVEAKSASKEMRNDSVPETAEKEKEEDAEEEGKDEEHLKEVREYGGVRWTSSLLPSPLLDKEEGVWASAGGDVKPEEGPLERKKSPNACVHAQWIIPVRCRVAKGSADDEFFSFLQVSTCATPALLSASPAVLDFGDVTVGAEARLRCSLASTPALASASASPSRHSGSSAAPAVFLRAEELPFSSCFELVSPLRPLHPEKPLTLSVAFHPRAPQTYRATLRLVGPLTRQSVELRGRGIRAELAVSPPEHDLDFGAVVVPPRSPGRGQALPASSSLCPSWTQHILTVRNPASSCAIRFRVECLYTSHPEIETCGAGRALAAFSCWPLHGEIAPEASQQFCFAFRPTKAEGLHTAVFRLVSGNGSQRPHYLYLRGLAVSHQLYALPPVSPFHPPSWSSFPSSVSLASSRPTLSPGPPSSSTEKESLLSCLPQPRGLCERPGLLVLSRIPVAGGEASTSPFFPLPSSAAPPASSPRPGPAVSEATSPLFPSFVSPLGQDSQRGQGDLSNSLASGCCRNAVFHLLFDDGPESPGERNALRLSRTSTPRLTSPRPSSPRLSSPRLSSPRLSSPRPSSRPASASLCAASPRGLSKDASSGSKKTVEENDGIEKGKSTGERTVRSPQPEKRESMEKASSGPDKHGQLRTRVFLLGAAWAPVPASASTAQVAGKGNSGDKGDAKGQGSGNKDGSSLETRAAYAPSSPSGLAVAACPVPSSLHLSSAVSSLATGSAPGKAPPFAEGKGEPVGQFEFSMEGEFAECFSVEPSRGSLAAGTQQPVTFSFNPVSRASSRTRAILQSAPRVVTAGQWVSAKARGVLKGGFVPATSSAAAQQEFEILLKAFCPTFPS
nr:TPA: Flagellar associated protein, related [Neospora caninum Liverpool]